MNEFTPEYISLCKNDKVQWLRPEYQTGDWYLWYQASIPEIAVQTFSNGETYTWLPTGDQLDAEIVKICKERKYVYNIKVSIYPEVIYGCAIHKDRYNIADYYESNTNPLIAKISLLIKLLESE